MADLNLDVATIRMLADRQRYEKLAKLVPTGTVNDATATIIKRLGEFFASNDVPRATHALFWPYLRTRYPKRTDDQVEFWKAATEPMDKDNPPGIEEQIITNLLSTNLGNAALELIEKWNNGGDVDLASSLREAVENYESMVTRRVKSADVELSWEEMIAEGEHPTGLEWHMEPLRENLRPLTGGDFGILALRPDRGKTSLGAYEVAGLAPQIPIHWPDRFRPALWLNNEGPGKRILTRIRQAVLALSPMEIAAIGKEAAQAAYIEKLGGNEDLIVVKDIHGFTSWDVETLIQRLDPGLVIWDMIDNIRFAGGTANNGERNDQVLEAMYQWARSLAVKYDHAGIAMSQLSAEAEGVRYPPQSHLKDSRTGKQGACDFIIAGGYDPMMPNTRFISTPKNKLKREGKPASLREPVYFDIDRGQFYVPKTVEEETIKDA